MAADKQAQDFKERLKASESLPARTARSPYSRRPCYPVFIIRVQQPNSGTWRIAVKSGNRCPRIARSLRHRV
jgi:hypothetical protein